MLRYGKDGEINALFGIEKWVKFQPQWCYIIYEQLFQGGGKTGSMYVLSYQVRWYIHANPLCWLNL